MCFILLVIGVLPCVGNWCASFCWSYQCRQKRWTEHQEFAKQIQAIQAQSPYAHLSNEEFLDVLGKQGAQTLGEDNSLGIPTPGMTS